MVSSHDPVQNSSSPRVSNHARERVQEMRLDTAEALTVVERPEGEYPGRPSSDGRPTLIAVARQLAVVVAADRSAIVTVLWRGHEGRDAA